MNISEEKEHIYAMMRDISDERRKLTDIYYGLKERMDHLNKIESRGIEDLSVLGYVDLYNRHMKKEKEQSFQNIQRDSQSAIQEVRFADNYQRESQPINQPIERVEQVQVERSPEPPEVIEQTELEIDPVEEVKVIIPASSVGSKQKEKTTKATKATKSKRKKRKTSSYLNIQEVINTIVDELKDYGSPMTLQALHKAVNDKVDQEITLNNFRNNILPRATKVNDRIEKPSRGFYQYKFNT